MNNSCANCPNQEKRLFCNLGEKAMAHFESISTTVRYAGGIALIREGDRCDSIFLVCSGRVKLSVTSRDGKTLILRVAGAGDALGLSAALSEGIFELTAETLEPCQMKVVRRQALMDFLARFPEASVQAARSVSQDYRSAFDDARRFALSGSSAGRLARLLLDWRHEITAGGQMDSHVKVPFTHEELACMTATTRETVTRTLGRFRKDNLISIKGISLTLLQPQALERLAAC
jgi:CRP/FNR family transcriptional regulator, cyclic AMP receptor protein